MEKNVRLKSAFKAAFLNSVPVLTGFLFLGTAYGILMDSKGYGVFWAVLMSIVAFCGSMQFVAITLLTSVFNPVQAFLMSLTVNARHIFYGIAMLEKYKGLGKIKGFLIYTLCDETFSIVSSIDPPADVNKKYFYFFVSLLDYFYWSLGTFIGGCLGAYVSFNTEGLDFVLTALIFVLFMEQWKKKELRWSGVVGVISTVVCLVVFGRDNFVIPSMILIAAVLLGRKKLCT